MHSNRVFRLPVTRTVWGLPMSARITIWWRPTTVQTQPRPSTRRGHCLAFYVIVQLIYYLLSATNVLLTIQRTTRCPRQLAHASRSTLSFYSSLSLPLWDYLPPQELLSSVLAIQARVLKYAVPSISSMEHQLYFSQVGALSLKNCLSYYCSFTTPEWGWPWWSHLSRPRPYVSPVRGKCACWPVLSSSLTEANGWQLHRITSCPNNLIFCPLPSRLRYSLIHASLASGNLPQKGEGRSALLPSYYWLTTCYTGVR